MKFPCPTCGSTGRDLSDDFLVVNIGESCAKCGDISYEYPEVSGGQMTIKNGDVATFADGSVWRVVDPPPRPIEPLPDSYAYMSDKERAAWNMLLLRKCGAIEPIGQNV